MQEYFDELYTEIETLVTIPVPMTNSGSSWYHEIISCQLEKGGVSAIFPDNACWILISQ
jgi:hypothetical protein